MGYSLCLPAWSIGEDCYDGIYDIVKRYGKTAVIIGGNTARQKAEHLIRAALEGKDFTIVDSLLYGDDATYECAKVLSDNPVVQQADMIFAVGGGRAVDTCKCAAKTLDKPIFTFPTIASNCAGSTAISVMYNTDHTFKDICYLKRCPEHVFLNSRLAADAPDHFMWAGIGDSLAKEFESEFASRGHKLFHTTILGLQAAKCCTGPFLEYSKKALEQNRAHEIGFELEQIVLDIVITAGIVSNMTISEGGKEYFYNSALSHAVYYGATMCPECEHHLHGEIVSFGTLCLLTCDKQFEKRDKLMEFNHSIGLPVTMGEIEMPKDEASLSRAADKAMSVVEWEWNPYEITKEQFIQSILDTDEAGRAFLARQ